MPGGTAGLGLQRVVSSRGHGAVSADPSCVDRWNPSLGDGGWGWGTIWATSDDMGMDQYLLIPFLVGWTSIYQLFWFDIWYYLMISDALTFERHDLRDVDSWKENMINIIIYGFPLNKARGWSGTWILGVSGEVVIGAWSWVFWRHHWWN